MRRKCVAVIRSSAQRFSKTTLTWLYNTTAIRAPEEDASKASPPTARSSAAVSLWMIHAWIIYISLDTSSLNDMICKPMLWIRGKTKKKIICQVWGREKRETGQCDVGSGVSARPAGLGADTVFRGHCADHAPTYNTNRVTGLQWARHACAYLRPRIRAAKTNRMADDKVLLIS